jgi:hypothetical protein
MCPTFLWCLGTRQLTKYDNPDVGRTLYDIQEEIDKIFACTFRTNTQVGAYGEFCDIKCSVTEMSQVTELSNRGDNGVMQLQKNSGRIKKVGSEEKHDAAANDAVHWDEGSSSQHSKVESIPPITITSASKGKMRRLFSSKKIMQALFRRASAKVPQIGCPSSTQVCER